MTLPIRETDCNCPAPKTDTKFHSRTNGRENNGEEIGSLLYLYGYPHHLHCPRSFFPNPNKSNQTVSLYLSLQFPHLCVSVSSPARYFLPSSVSSRSSFQNSASLVRLFLIRLSCRALMQYISCVL